MGFGKLFQLLIPRKGSADTTDLDTNWRAIERWAQNVGGIREITSQDGTVTVVDPLGPVTDLSAHATGGGYASLTGPGESTSPGALLQNGDFEIFAGAGAAVVTVAGAAGGSITAFADAVSIGTSSTLGVFVNSGFNNVAITAGSSPGSSAGISVTAGVTGSVIIQTDATGALGFFGGGAQTQHANIPAPGGGATVDVQARVAINGILNLLGSSYYNLMG